MLLTCPLTRCEGFSIERFGVPNKSKNVVLTASKERDFRGHSLVQYSTFLGFLVCSDPQPSHLLLVFQHSLGPRRQDTDFVFVLRWWKTSANCPSKRLSSAAKTVKTCRSTWTFPNFLFLFDWIDLNLQRSTSRAFFYEMVSQFIPEILDSIGCSQIFSVS